MCVMLQCSQVHFSRFHYWEIVTENIYFKSNSIYFMLLQILNFKFRIYASRNDLLLSKYKYTL